MTGSVDSIIQFLESRIAEDEARPQRAAEGEAEKVRSDGMPDVTAEDVLSNWREMAEAGAWFPWTRMLAECKAKRAILDMYKRHRENHDARRSCRSREAEDEKAALERRIQEARTQVAEDCVRALASVYDDHPEYQQEWAI